MDKTGKSDTLDAQFEAEFSGTPAEYVYQILRGGTPTIRWESWLRLTAFGELKLEVIDGELLESKEQLIALLGLLLEYIGADAAVKLGDAGTWLAAAENRVEARAGRRRCSTLPPTTSETPCSSTTEQEHPNE